MCQLNSGWFWLTCDLRTGKSFDAFVSNHFAQLADLPLNAVVGTSSLRRQCQLRKLRPDLVIKDLRGNVNTRLAKLDAGGYDAIILAAAGLIRLDMQHVSNNRYLPNQFTCCGARCRWQSNVVMMIMNWLRCLPLWSQWNRHPRIGWASHECKLNGGCQVPIGSFAEIINDTLHLRGLVGSLDGVTMFTSQC